MQKCQNTKNEEINGSIKMGYGYELRTLRRNRNVFNSHSNPENAI